MLTVYSSCKLKTRPDERQGIKLPLEAIAFYLDSFVAQKINVEGKSGRELGLLLYFSINGKKS